MNQLFSPCYGILVPGPSTVPQRVLTVTVRSQLPLRFVLAKWILFSTSPWIDKFIAWATAQQLFLCIDYKAVKQYRHQVVSGRCQLRVPVSMCAWIFTPIPTTVSQRLFVGIDYKSVNTVWAQTHPRRVLAEWAPFSMCLWIYMPAACAASQRLFVEIGFRTNHTGTAWCPGGRRSDGRSGCFGPSKTCRIDRIYKDAPLDGSRGRVWASCWGKKRKSWFLHSRKNWKKIYLKKINLAR